MLKFALIGDGAIAKYHRKAIEHVGGEIKYVFDPAKENTDPTSIPNLSFPNYVNYAVICSPSNFHRPQIKSILNEGRILNGIICEKPAFLPWENMIESEKINIVLQLRYLPNLPKKADLVSVRFVRDEAYFKSWKGDARNTGGLFYNLFIHFVDLAIRLGADFEGVISNKGEQERFIGTKWSFQGWAISPELVATEPRNYFKDEDKLDILNIDMQGCYNRLYEDIIEGKGVKPNDLCYLSWVLQHNSDLFGYGRGCLGQTITIKNELT